tara:strand:- start:1911 stop:3140 length:1230 start_codon:yes stop_codon:yes gene_type:complete
MIATNPLYQLTSQKIKYGLERTIAMLKACNNPHEKLNIVQVAGTNGKGSTSCMLANILIQNNYKTGLFTSPHLIKLNERIQINNVQIDDEFINEFIEKYKKDIATIQPSFFEVITVLALDYFVKERANIVILETGLGGRLDSVTATKPKVVVYTSIDYDHMHILGNTIEKIALEKAGAITKSTQMIISCMQKEKVAQILEKVANSYKKKIIFNIYDPKKKYEIGIPGYHQQRNAQLAHCAIKSIQEFFQIKLSHITQSINSTFWPGRIQILQNHPDVIFDVSHNEQSVNAFIKYFKSIYKKYDSQYLIVGFEATKDVKNIMLALTGYFTHIILTETNIRTSMSVKVLNKMTNHRNVNQTKNPITAINNTLLKMQPNDCLIILGSHYFGPYIDQVFKNCFVMDKKNLKFR